MAALPHIVPVTDLRQDAAAVLRRVQTSDEPLVITQRGRAAAVMISVDAYERGEHERRLLRLLLRGEQEIAADAGYDLDAVLAEEALARHEEIESGDVEAIPADEVLRDARSRLT